MVKKRKVVAGIQEDEARAHKRVRNRASLIGLFKLYEFLSPAQGDTVAEMELETMLGIKCHCVNNKLITWFAGLYDKHTREFVILVRGRIPLDEDLVFRTLGLPYGTKPLVYAVDSMAEAALAHVLFPADGSTPLTSRVYNILKDMTESGVPFKQIFVMYVISTVLSPTTRNHVSNRCYPVMANIANVHKLKWCKFVVDQLHYELSKGKVSQGCLFHLQLLYVDSVDVSALDLELPEGRFAATIWSKENIDKVLLTNLQNDGESYGKLELKRQFGIDYTLFGGAMGFSKWVDTCADRSCSIEQKAQVANLMGTFASGIVGLMGSLVQGWTALNGNAGVHMADKFAGFSAGIVTGGASCSTAAARVTRATRKRLNSSLSPRPAAGKSPILLPDDEYLGDDTSSEESSESDVDKYLVVTRKKEVSPGGKGVHGVDNVVPHSTSVAKTGLHSDDIITQPGMDHSNGNSEDNAVVQDRNDGLNVSVSEQSAELAESVAVNNSIAKDLPIIPEAVSVSKSIANDAPIVPEDVGINQTILEDSAIIPEGSAAMDVDESSKVSDSAAIPHAPEAHGSKLSVSSDVVEAPVLRVYKSTKGKGKLCTLRQKDSRIRAIMCNELGITSEMAALCSTTNLNDAGKASPRRGDDTGSSFVPIATFVASPVYSPGPATIPEEANIHDGSSLLEGAPSVDREGSLFFPASSLFNNVVADVSTHVPCCKDSPKNAADVEVKEQTNDIPHTGSPSVPEEANIHDASTLPEVAPSVDTVADVSTDVPCRKDSPKNAADVEVKEQTNDIPHTGSPGVFVPARPLFTDKEFPLWNFTSQSPVSQPAMVSSPINAATDGGPCNPTIPLSYATDVPLAASSVCVDDIPLAIPMAGASVAMGGTSTGVGCHAHANTSSNVHSAGDLFDEFEPHGLIVLPIAVFGKMPVKDESDVISLDDLVTTKIGAHGYDILQKSRHYIQKKIDFVTDAHAYSTPAMNKEGNVVLSANITPKTRLRTVRVIQPSKVLLPPFSYIPTSKYQDSLYEKVIVHTFEEEKSKIKGSRILHIEPMWVNTSELAGSMKPSGELSNTVCDIAISVLQDSCSDKKVIFPHIVMKYLLDHKFDARILCKHFRKDSSYKLSHKDLLSFPVLQTLGTPIKGKKPIEHCTDCRFFMLKFLEVWNGSVVPAISQDQIPSLRKVFTALWLEHPRNELVNWRHLLDSNMF
ncbi:hypothetical protein ACQ4PT_045604 [Festuca glaucescens]